MSKSELLKELRALTQAGMKDCNDALKEAGDDLQKAVDIIKSKGQNIVSGREGKVAAEGIVMAAFVENDKTAAMIEVNCQTDFVSRNPDFKQFAEDALTHLCGATAANTPFDVNETQVRNLRTSIMAKTKENCLIRRWWVEQVFEESCKTFIYIHNNNRLGVILSLKAPSVETSQSSSFQEIGMDLAMQIAAMNPIAVSVDRLPVEMVERQKAIFEAQLRELNKPQAQWSRIIEGKLNKWYTEVCLTKQESVVVAKKSIEQLIDSQYAALLGGKIEIVNFIRCQVGEGIEQQTKSDFTDEVAKLSGIPAAPDPKEEQRRLFRDIP